MRSSRPLFRACALVILLVVALLPGSATAQSPSPTGTGTEQAEKGLCSPWHHCVALGVAGMVGLYTLFMLGMLGYQRRGFDTVEHKMGSPQGVPAKRE